jgi:hypothetical protein
MGMLYLWSSENVIITDSKNVVCEKKMLAINLALFEVLHIAS